MAVSVAVDSVVPGAVALLLRGEGGGRDSVRGEQHEWQEGGRHVADQRTPVERCGHRFVQGLLLRQTSIASRSK